MLSKREYNIHRKEETEQNGHEFKIKTRALIKRSLLSRSPTTAKSVRVTAPVANAEPLFCLSYTA